MYNLNFQCGCMFYYQISMFIGKSLGFDVGIPDCSYRVFNGAKLDGSAGFIEINNVF